MHRMVEYDAERDTIDVMSDAFTLWVPKMFLMDSEDVLERMNEYMANGEEVWWYVCWEPGSPYCNFYVNEIGLNHIELFWQQYYYEVEGILYWHTTYWKYVNPWEDMATVPYLSKNVFGDGSLLYPGNPMGIEGPVASFRMDCIRNGMEDYDLLLMAEELFGREWVVEQVQTVSESLTVHTSDPAVYASVRKTIAEAIEAEVNK